MIKYDKYMFKTTNQILKVIMDNTNTHKIDTG